MIKDIDNKLLKIKEDMDAIKSSTIESDKIMYKQLKKGYEEVLIQGFRNLVPSDRVYLARHPQRPKGQEYIAALFPDFYPLYGDRLSGEDKSILGGIASFHNIPITVIAQCKGRNLEENLSYNFGMANPCGYRKVQRLVKQAEKFRRPIITFIDTPGAYPGPEAEQKGQGEAIASCLALFSDVEVPVIAIVIGEGSSGGALALGVANTVIMLENSIYTILSPEGFASILFKDASKSQEITGMMKLTAQDLKAYGIIDIILDEGIGGAHHHPTKIFAKLDNLLQSELSRLLKIKGTALAEARYQKFRIMGNVQ